MTDLVFDLARCLATFFIRKKLGGQNGLVADNLAMWQAVVGYVVPVSLIESPEYNGEYTSLHIFML